MSLFSVHKTIHESTAVEFCVCCEFLGFNGRQLVVCGANVLKVYQLVPSQQDLTLLGNVADPASITPKMRLSCIFSATLHGRPLSLNVVKLPGSVRHALLFAFSDAKLTIADYNPLKHDLSILTMHCYEDEEIRPGSLQVASPMVRVDPENRCAAMLLYGQRVAVIPFRREVCHDDESGARRSPVLPSYVINLSNLDTRISNVIDIQFLHGYYEPTLAFLFEPLRTYSGRLAVRRDTCQFVAVSLNTAQRVHPVIWSVDRLPFDCLRIVEVPRPLSGALVFAVNSAIYINQSVPAYGVSLNSATESSTRFPLKTVDGVKMTLDGAQSVFISPEQLILSLRSGDLYVLTIVADSMRAVRSISLERSACSVLTSCMALCDDKYLFLGSRLGNSLLLRVQEKSGESDANNTSKRRKIDDMLSNRDTLDLEELEVYGDEDVTQTTLKQYSFEVCDSILNHSPCGQLVMGQPPFLSEEFTALDDPDIELIATSGFGKNGALSVLRRSVRPQVVTTFSLPDCEDMWTVIDASSPSPAPPTGSHQHAFLLLRLASTTMVLQTAEAINELDSSGFDTGSPTVLAANLADNRLIVQVTPTQVILLSGSRRVDVVTVDFGGAIVAASVADPYTIVYTDHSQVALVELVNNKLRMKHLARLSKPDLVLATAFVDESGLFSSEVPSHIQHELLVGGSGVTASRTSPAVAANSASASSAFPSINTDLDDEDEMLYGDSSTLNPPVTKEQKNDDFNTPSIDWLRWQRRPERSRWLILAYRSGDAVVHRLPDCRVAATLTGLGRGVNVLGRSGNTAGDNVASSEKNIDVPLIRELNITCLGHMRSRPVLTALLDNDQLLIYEAFPCYASALTDDHLKVLFKRVKHCIVAPSKSTSAEADTGSVRVCRMRQFDNVAGFRGLFLCGANPHWLLMTSRGEIRLHPMHIDGRIGCFAGFNNVNCPQGFLYFNRKDELRICVLPSHLLYDCHWPMRKITLRRTPHFICYHLETKTYLVCTSHAQPSMNVYKFTGDDKELCVEDRDDRFPYPLQKTFCIQLYSPVSWEIVPKATIELQEWETVTTMKNVSLTYEGHRSGQRVYIAVGTNFSYGEDVVCHGKVVLLDIIEVVPEPGQPLTRYKLKTILEKEQTAPVTAVGAVCGYLLGAVGQKLYVWSLKDNDLVGLAFIDTQMYIHQLHAMKSLILAGDVWKSLCVLRFQTDFRTLSVVGRDFKCRDICSVEFMVDNTQVGFMTTDYECNALVFVYQPESRDSCGGVRLIRRADFQLSSRVHTMSRLRCRLTDTSAEKKHPPIVGKRHLTLYANVDGGLGMFLPVPEKTYRRLVMLQTLMYADCAHQLGLNPRSFRMYCSRRHEMAPPTRGVLDGDLLYEFVSLPLADQQQLARRAGLKVDGVIDDLSLICQLTAHF